MQNKIYAVVGKNKLDLQMLTLAFENAILLHLSSDFDCNEMHYNCEIRLLSDSEECADIFIPAFQPVDNFVINSIYYKENPALFIAECNKFKLCNSLLCIDYLNDCEHRKLIDLSRN
ncbi:hypothetical protein [uncultured Deefgea sp.]|uniref:hypothetical protein n=1 Tax=uncultured Deefgea sp. TaxID=1304914 RepID=UPI00260C182C|nr:hypothetical protein [uncultured Deefgea sp.]